MSSGVKSRSGNISYPSNSKTDVIRNVTSKTHIPRDGIPFDSKSRQPSGDEQPRVGRNSFHICKNSNWRNQERLSVDTSGALRSEDKSRSSKQQTKRVAKPPSVKNIIRDILTQHPNDIDVIIVKLEEIIQSSSEKSAVLDVIVSCHLHEALTNSQIIKSVLYSRFKNSDKHGHIHWINWSAYMAIPAFKRSIIDIELTLQALYDAGCTPLEKNHDGETAIGSLRQAYKQKRFNEEIYNRLLYLYTYPSREVVNNCVIMILNKLTDKTIDSLGSSLRWVMTYDPQMLAREVIQMCSKYNHSITKERGVYECIRVFISLIKKTFTSTCKDDDDFKEYFDTNEWDAKMQIDAFNSYVTDNIMTMNLSAINTDFRSPVMLGALLGECKISTKCIEFINKCFDCKDGSLYAVGLTCYAHLGINNLQIMSRINEIHDSSSTESFIMFAIENMFEQGKSKVQQVQTKTKVQRTKAKIPKTEQYSIKKSQYTFMDVYNENTDLFEKLGRILTNLKKFTSNMSISCNPTSLEFTPACIDDISYSLSEILKNSEIPESGRIKINITVAFITQLMNLNVESYHYEAAKVILTQFAKHKVIDMSEISTAIIMICNDKDIIIDHLVNICDMSQDRSKNAYEKVMNVLGVFQ